MPLKVIRRPYQDCAYRWALSTSGISTGEGDCSDEQCEDLNGDFNLDFSACASKGGKLVWAGDCELSGGTGGDADSSCGRYRIDVSGVSGFDCAATYNGSFITRAYSPDPGCDFCLYVTPKKSASNQFVNGSCECVASPQQGPFVDSLFGYDISASVYAFFDDNALTCLVSDANRLLINGSISRADYRRPFGIFGTTAGDVITFTLESAECGTWPATITATRLDSTGGGTSSSTGPETNDRIRSKWHLDYDINAQLWTLRSFNRIDYPIYTLSDANPCDGDTKTLLLADKGDAADGCGVAPAEMTITRVCPPDRVGKSALLEDRKPNGATGKRKRQCGCDCLDEVDDRRQCATKCASTEDEGCGNINPAPDDITCRYPEAINCCANTAGKDVPCAYTVEFECDLFYDIEDVRHKIAAKQVVLRRECYFEDPCLFVAPGPESSTGGSPVMDVDGYPGAQPVCASCADPCLTGCTWSAYTVAACPGDPLSEICDPLCNCNECWQFTIGEIHYDGALFYSGGTITLTPHAESCDPFGPNRSTFVATVFDAATGHGMSIRFETNNCTRVLEFTTDISCATTFGNGKVVYGGSSTFGGIGQRGCYIANVDVCETPMTLARCFADDRCTGIVIDAPSSVTISRIDCP